MNHTAHCYLSYGNEDLLVGNFIGDFVKGKSWQRYLPGIQRGILLHRTIDSFTDNHPETARSVARIRPFAGRYAPPVVDILYDHLLCKHWETQTVVSFEVFASWTYAVLEKRAAEMPPVLQKRLPYMLDGKFLHGYQTRTGVEWVLGQFAKRLTGKLVDTAALSAFFFSEIDKFSEDFQAFFPDLEERVRRELDTG